MKMTFYVSLLYFLFGGMSLTLANPSETQPVVLSPRQPQDETFYVELYHLHIETPRRDGLYQLTFEVLEDKHVYFNLIAQDKIISGPFSSFDDEVIFNLTDYFTFANTEFSTGVNVHLELEYLNVLPVPDSLKSPSAENGWIVSIVQENIDFLVTLLLFIFLVPLAILASYILIYKFYWIPIVEKKSKIRNSNLKAKFKSKEVYPYLVLEDV